ncbi:MAG: hypothetical protein ACE5FD_08975 [Anaerolineae bacterium]
MARKPQTERLQAIYNTIESNPGRRPSFVARILNLPRSAITRALPALENEGLLLSEDDRGRLWPLRRRHH